MGAELLILGLPSVYEVEHLSRVFFPGAPLRKTKNTKGRLVYARAGRRRLAVALRTANGCVVKTAPLPQQTGVPAKKLLCDMLYPLLCEATGQRPPWGMLTGVRPVRLLRNRIAEYGVEEAQALFLEEYGVSEEKYNLAKEILQRQQPVLEKTTPQDYSLYVSVPFCPTRCTYCSFVSRTTRQDAALIDDYLQKMEQEMAQTAEVARAGGLRLSTIYIGGGTPTALNRQQLKQLLEAVRRHFDTSSVMEYTVEAGRPDCTDYEKLHLLKEYGVSRISINPQTMNDTVLQAIGRRHTAEDVRRCFEQARRAGHSSINMDLIAGLPKDSEESFFQTLREVIALQPENITLHTLTLKRASDLVLEQKSGDVSLPVRMVEGAGPVFRSAGFFPYYLYRQKNTLQNLENIGWAKPGHTGLYNVHIMEETQTILAVGAAASTKLVWQNPAKIQRIFNPKYPMDYILNFKQVLSNKKGVTSFYAGNLDT